MLSVFRNLMNSVGAMFAFGIFGLSLCATGVLRAQDNVPPIVQQAVAATGPAAKTESVTTAAHTESSNPETLVPILPKYDTGSTAWLMVSSALVFFMMPGLASLLRRNGPSQRTCSIYSCA